MRREQSDDGIDTAFIESANEFIEQLRRHGIVHRIQKLKHQLTEATSPTQPARRSHPRERKEQIPIIQRNGGFILPVGH